MNISSLEKYTLDWVMWYYVCNLLSRISKNANIHTQFERKLMEYFKMLKLGSKTVTFCRYNPILENPTDTTENY